jgi:hypothetical protein
MLYTHRGELCGERHHSKNRTWHENGTLPGGWDRSGSSCQYHKNSTMRTKKYLTNFCASSQAKELLPEYPSTDVTDVQLINASNLLKEFGITAKP